ncbi:MAG: hypothetical protein K2X27_07405 [Candidatus Obscuribacterales bacterium]|nr:hypothetical protein [Candidatus Obscuribacterales bacterium]
MVSSLKIRKSFKRSDSSDRRVELTIVRREVHPYRCACALVKSGGALQCPVHLMAALIPRSYH